MNGNNQMDGITVKEAVRLKTKLESDILNLVAKFEDITGTEIENIELNRVDFLGERSQCVGVWVDVHLGKGE